MTRSGAAFCVGALLALALIAPTTRAASRASSLEPPDLSRYLRWGPLRVRPGIELSQLGHDDNILLGDSGEQVSDYTATISPRLDGLVLFGSRAFLTFEEKLAYTLYVENDDQNFLDTRSSARLTVPLKRVGFFLDASLNDLKYRPVDREDLRAEADELRYGLGAIFNPGWRTEIFVRQTFGDLEYRDPDTPPGALLSIDKRLNRTEQATRVDVRYAVLGRSYVLLDLERKQIDFDALLPIENKPLEFASIDRDAREWRLLGGMEFGEGGALTGKVQIGWARIRARDERVADFDDMIGEAQLVYRFNDRTRARIEARRLPGFASYRENIYLLETEFGGRVVHYFNRLFGIESGGSYGRLTFPSELSNENREDTLKRYDVGIRLRLSENTLGRRVEYSFRIGRYRRESTEIAVRRSQNTVAFGAVLGF